MTERPILFNGSMVRAILEGRKRQTRRIADTGLYAIDEMFHGAEIAERERANLLTQCPQGQPGDRLWVRETWASDDGVTARYRADGETYNAGLPWRPSIHMPRWASRITLEVTGVSIERLQDISEEDARAEGIGLCDGIPGVYIDYLETSAEQLVGTSAIGSFRSLWNSIYQDGKSWDANPWVWDVEFRVAEVKR